ncbi:MAG: glycosyltransferase family 2 protein [Bdellovibrionales bacterium]|nr:glycosyltransferase family 2 protein [Bdellovibrionales bacterium]
MKIQALIITHRRKALLQVSLDSLRTELPTGSEVHVLINGTDPETETFLNETAKSFPIPILVSKNEGEPKSPADARNQILKSLTIPTEIGKTWVLFLDDDASLIPGSFRAFQELQAANPTARVLGGPNLTPPDSTPFETWVGQALCSPFATYHSNLRYRQGYGNLPGSETNLILCCLWVEASLVAGKSVFKNFLVCAEENAWLIELENEKIPIFYSDRLACFHHRRPDPKSLFLQIVKYAKGRGQVIRSLRSASTPVTYWVPSLCLAIEAVGFVHWILTHDPSYFWLILNGIYLGLCFVFSALELLRDIERFRQHGRRNRLYALGAVASLFPLIHAGYGLGLIQGFFNLGPKRSQ